MRNYTLSQDYFNSSYTLKAGTRYGHTDNRERVVMACLVIDRVLTVKEAANKSGRCENTIRNWIKTIDHNNPHMDG